MVAPPPPWEPVLMSNRPFCEEILPRTGWCFPWEAWVCGIPYSDTFSFNMKTLQLGTVWVGNLTKAEDTWHLQNRVLHQCWILPRSWIKRSHLIHITPKCWAAKKVRGSNGPDNGQNPANVKFFWVQSQDCGPREIEVSFPRVSSQRGLITVCVPGKAAGTTAGVLQCGYVCQLVTFFF